MPTSKVPEMPGLPELPFPITVCGLEELKDHAERHVSHVLSILDPDQEEPEAFGAYGEHARLELKFHDIIDESAYFRAPTGEHMAQILDFGRNILCDPDNIRHLLVHCHMGISRSTAAMALLLAQAQPHLPARDVLGQVLAIRDRAWPNSRMLALGEQQLKRDGEFTKAVAQIYRIQLNRKPAIKDFFAEVGRQREVDMAMAFQA